MAPDREAMPYRPCVGMMLANAAGRIWVGRRADWPSALNDSSAWQMPQGGIDDDEDPRTAALRELYEETNVTSVRILAESSIWLRYDLPDALLGKALKGRFRGQEQKWFLALFEGDESEVDIRRPGGGAHKPEFDEWRWIDAERLVELIVPFKRPVYEALVGEFGPFLEKIADAPLRPGQAESTT